MTTHLWIIQGLLASVFCARRSEWAMIGVNGVLLLMVASVAMQHWGMDAV